MEGVSELILEEEKQWVMEVSQLMVGMDELVEELNELVPREATGREGE